MRKLWLLSVFLPSILLVFMVCSEDDNPVNNDPSKPDPPIGLFGCPVEAQSGINIQFFWTSDLAETIDGYNQYLKIGDSDFVKVNHALIPPSVGRPGPGGTGNTKCQNIQFAIDTSLIIAHAYYMTAVRDSVESDPSDTVFFIPNQVILDQSVDSLEPNNGFVDDVVPSFSWAVVTGAESYVVFLGTEDDTTGNGWILRQNMIEIFYKSTSGITYLDLVGDSLTGGTDYEWTLWAIDSNNCGMASSAAVFSVLNEYSPLGGFYSGIYEVLDFSDYSVSWQYINWTFSDTKFWCEADTTLGPAFTCDFAGNYILETQVTFSNLIVEPGICNLDDIPEGEFAFFRIGDTLKFEQTIGQAPDRVRKTIKLAEAAE